MAKKSIKKPRNQKIDAVAQENETRSLALQSLLLNPGWDILVDIFGQNIKYLEAQIIAKQDADTGKPLTEAQCDELRFKVEYLRELLDKPQEMIDDLAPKGERDKIDHDDPYAQRMSEVQP